MRFRLASRLCFSCRTRTGGFFLRAQEGSYVPGRETLRSLPNLSNTTRSMAGTQYATRAHPGRIVSSVRSSIRYESRAIGVPGLVVLTLIGTFHRAR